MPYLNASTKKRNVNIWMFPSPKPNSTLSLLFLHSLFQWLAPQQTVGIILRAFNWEWGLPPIPDFLLCFTNSCQFFLPHISGTWYLHSIFSSLTISSHHASWFIAIVSLPGYFSRMTCGFSHFSEHQNHVEGLSKHTAVATPEFLIREVQLWPKTWISTFPEDDDEAGLGPHSENHCFTHQSF